jgi:hypothetical protein
MDQLSAKLSRLLRNVPALQFVIATLTALLRRGQIKTESVANSLGDAPEITNASDSRGSLDGVIAGIEVSAGLALVSGCHSEREKLIRRRWMETGIKMWNPDVHGIGKAALKIQGREGVLPIKPGQALPGYDELEFKLLGSRIICEDVVVDPPNRRHVANSR